ncbi:uncharacterized protein SOCE26_017970 [Sorangium cellulosum]|uniref:Secreted protein n=1 Tax=Sorangium cellulosum TaxID=56 RepID=A0A2L0EM72_SORCE|nr:hypothetical protein [Sorangium cellulosum]AUX40396.1 uncharacterized protein SOCE26_017970 [Sorangium cellulosum]
MPRSVLLLLSACAVVFLSPRVFGHFATMTQSRATIEPSGEVAYTLQIPASDLAEALALPSHRAATVGEIRAGEDLLFAYFLARIHIEADGTPCPIERRGAGNVEDTEIRAELRFVGRCPAEARAVDIVYDVFFDHDPQHIGILELTRAGKTAHFEFTRTARRYRADRTAADPGQRPLAVAGIVGLLLAATAVTTKGWLRRRRRGANDES